MEGPSEHGQQVNKHRIQNLNDEGFWFTITRSFFNDMKRFGCLVFLSLSMSRGRRRGCCKASARYVTYPFWDSQIVASQEMGAPSSSSRGDHVHCPLRMAASSQLSTDLALLSLGSLAFFYCLAFCGPTFPSSRSSIGLFLLRFGLACRPRSVEGGGAGRGRLGGTCTLGTSLVGLSLVPIGH